MKGPAIFLAQFIRDYHPFNSLDSLCEWAAGHGFKGVQLPTHLPWLLDLHLASTSEHYVSEYQEKVRSYGLEITELSTHLQGQLVAVHPAYDALLDGFAPPEVRGRPDARTKWAIDQVKMAARASARFGLTSQVTFSGSLLWPYMFPWPPRPDGLVEEAFKELSTRWLPILEVHDQEGIDLCFELHPTEDLHDGLSFERFLDSASHHSRACINYDPSHFLLQSMDYLGFIDHYHERIKAFHVKDAEFRPSAKAGVYGGWANWSERPGRFRSVGDGQVDFKSIFTKLTQYGYSGWAVLEWECFLKDSEQGAREGAQFIANHLINPAREAFDDFADTGTDQGKIKKILGIDHG